MSIPSHSHKHALAGKRIIVTGAGIAGMTFARALHLNWPDNSPEPEVVIYERSSKVLDRGRDGYTMGIRGESGLRALNDIGLLPKALELSTVRSDKYGQRLPTFWMKDWSPMLEFGASREPTSGIPSNIRLVRYVLRDILLEGLPEQTAVHWDRSCESARSLEDGRVEVTLSDGSTDTCDLLVSADGANSSIRNTFLPEQHLEFAGAICYCGTSRFPNGKPELLKERWGMNISGSGVCFLTFPVDSTTGVWALGYRSETPVERVRGAEAVKRQKELLDDVYQRGHMLAEPFKQFVSATDPETLSLFSAMHKYPIQHAKDIPNTNVVFIGDANHPMSPFSGNGANMALVDGVELAKRLISADASTRTAIESFDEESVPRSKAAIDKSWYVIRALHAKGVTFLALRTLLATISWVVWVKAMFGS